MDFSSWESCENKGITINAKYNFIYIKKYDNLSSLLKPYTILLLFYHLRKSCINSTSRGDIWFKKKPWNR